MSGRDAIGDTQQQRAKEEDARSIITSTYPHRSMHLVMGRSSGLQTPAATPSIHGPGRVMRCTHLQQTLLEFGTLHAAAPLVGSTQQSAEPSFTSTRPGSTRDSTMHSKEIKGAKGIESLPCAAIDLQTKKGAGLGIGHPRMSHELQHHQCRCGKSRPTQGRPDQSVRQTSLAIFTSL